MRIQHTIIRFDWMLLLTALALTSIGLIVVYGIGVSRSDANLFVFQKQLTALGIGMAVIVACLFFDYRQLRGLALPLYGFGLLLLAGVLPFGSMFRGTRGWYSIGSLSFQPVEVAKVFLVLFLASYLVRYAHGRLPWHAIAASFFATGGYVGMVMLQPDFGSAMVMLAIWGCMILFVGLPWKTVLVLGLSALVLAGLTWFLVLNDLQRARFITFIDRSADARGAGYNVEQAGIAIGSGGLFGKGIGEGSQSRLRFLPEAATDFTFAVIGEELGFAGIAFMLAMFGLFFYRFLMIAKQSEDDFAALILFGIGTMLLIHIVINAGMNLGIMPVTGIPLPFVSAASSFLVSVYLAVGIIESIAVRRKGSG